MALIANITIISSGIGIGFPAATLKSLTNENTTNSEFLTTDEASWFGN